VKKYGCVSILMLVWCGGTGVGVYFTARTILRHLDAQSRFVPVEATVEKTDIVSSRRAGRKVRVKFSYEAGGSRRTAIGPGFEDSDSGFLEHDAAAYPEGLKTTAWVDPRRPEVAILDRRITQDTWWSVILLQPFIAISLGALVAMLRAPSESRHEREFLRQPVAYPWQVPEWGVFEERGTVLSIYRPPTILRSATIAWGVSTFLGAFGSGMIAAGFDLDYRILVAPILGLCLLVSAGIALRSHRRGGQTVTIDRTARTVTIVDPRGERQIRWAAIRDLREWFTGRSRRTGPYGGRVAIRRKEGSEEVLMDFTASDDPRAISKKVGDHLAEVLETRVVSEEV
jgi:hypothetical protein